MKSIPTARVEQIIQKFKGKKILVLGDLMLDRYVWGKVKRISPEAPVPVVAVNKDTSCLGGAGNVSHNLKSLGAEPVLVGVVGDDFSGEWIKQNVSDARGVFTLPQRSTTVKTRIIAHHQQVVRVDYENRDAVPSSFRQKIFAFIQKEPCDGIVVSDYNKGMISQPLMKSLLAYTSDNDIPVYIDPKVENFSIFSPVTLITPNHLEASKIVHRACESDAAVAAAGKKIFSRISTRYLIIKRGEQGMTVFENNQDYFHIPTIAKEVFDVTGAGDTVISAAALALLSGASIQEAAILANIAAGLVVAKIGTATVTVSELLKALEG
jgi:D-glycero-beta-D-manno-heptose-7-phosphate kinase